MKRRTFIKRGALFAPIVPMIFVPRLIRGQGVTRQMQAVVAKKQAGGGGGIPSANLVQNSDASTISGSDNDLISTWVATVGKDATAAGDARPTLQTAELNGLNVVRFDGIDDILTSANFDSSLAQPYTVFIVYNYTGGSGTTDYIFDGKTSGRSGIFNYGVTGTISLYAGVAIADTTFSGASGWHILSVDYSGVAGVDTKVRLDNGTESTVSVAPGGDTITGFVLGNAIDGSVAGAVDVAQLLIYTGSIAEKSAHFSALQTKFGL